MWLLGVSPMLSLIRNLLCVKSGSAQNNEVVSIVTFRAAFELSVEEVRQALAKCDMGCPNGHYSKLVGSLPVDLNIVCIRQSKQHNILTSNFLHENVHCSLGRNKDVGMGL